jgi:hypothetical protein
MYCTVYSIMRNRECHFIEASIAKTFTLNFQASINFKNHQRIYSTQSTDFIAERPSKQISSRDPIFLSRRGGGGAYGAVKKNAGKLACDK